MRRLIVKGAAFLLVGLVLLHGLAWIVDTVALDGTAYLLRLDRQNVQAVLADADAVEAIAVGSSHGDSLDFSATQYRGYQLSRAWGDVFEMQYYLDYFIPRLSSLQVVFMPVSYNTFTQDNGRVLPRRRDHMYRTIPSQRFISGDGREFLTARFDAIVPVKRVTREDHWKQIFFGLLTGARPEGPTDDGCRHMDGQALARHARTRVQEQAALTAAIVAQKAGIADESYAVFAGIIRSLQERGVRVVLFTPPYSRAYTEAYVAEDPAAIALTERLLDRLLAETSADYYDFSRDGRFAEDERLFADSDHLNSCGKRQFSAQLSAAHDRHLRAAGDGGGVVRAGDRLHGSGSPHD